jgi:hypothetical protein
MNDHSESPNITLYLRFSPSNSCLSSPLASFHERSTTRSLVTFSLPSAIT